MNVEPKFGVAIYHAASGDDFCLAEISRGTFAAKVRGQPSGDDPTPVLAVVIRRLGKRYWFELRDEKIPGLCIDDIHAMAKLWRKYGDEAAKRPRAYP